MSLRIASFALAGTAVLLVGGVGAWWSTLPTSGAAQAQAVLPVVQMTAADAAAGASTSADGSAPAPGDASGGQASATGSSTGGSSTAGSASEGPAQPGPALLPASLVSPGWLTSTAKATGIPRRALQAYGAASIVSQQRHPGCALGWNTLAAIGTQESANGTVGGARIGDDGRVVGTIVGPTIEAGPAKGERALGPMQMIPSTWARYRVDGNGDGVDDPNQIDDAALAAADYLCVAGGDLSTASGWNAAVHAYNPSDPYVEAVRGYAAQYAQDSAP